MTVAELIQTLQQVENLNAQIRIFIDHDLYDIQMVDDDLGGDEVQLNAQTER